MGSLPEPLHFVLFPFMAQGHMIPMVDIGLLLAQRGANVTIVTTPGNAARFEQSLERATAAGLPITTLQVKLPAAEHGFPEGCESFDMLPTWELALKFFYVINSQYDSVEKVLLEQLTTRPSCFISDMCLHYTAKLANKFQVPRIQFHGFCSFALLCLHNIRKARILEHVEWDTEYVTIPGLEEKVELKADQLPLTSRDEEWSRIHDKMEESEQASYGVIVNSFEELEPGFVDMYKEAKHGKVWCFGPVSSLSHMDNQAKAHRGSKASVADHECLTWLDGQVNGSVVYACLGSLSRFSHSQLVELGLGLEASNKPFIWVIRGTEKSPEIEKWISEDGFEERVRGRGLLIKGWAPQLLILSHPAVGGFLTHCGWNSIIEGVSCGVPFITWPLFADQFCNEKLVVQVLKIGVSIGVQNPDGFGEVINNELLVKKESIGNAVVKLMMDDGEEGEGRRKRVMELAKAAKKAVDVGGSSQHNIMLFIQDIMQKKKAPSFMKLLASTTI